MAIELSNGSGNSRPIGLLEWIRSEFNLPSNMIPYCSQHFLRVWEGSYVLTHVHDGKLAVRSGGEEWIIHWASTPEVCKTSKRVACSFREFEGNKYVVIKAWKVEE